MSVLITHILFFMLMIDMKIVFVHIIFKPSQGNADGHSDNFHESKYFFKTVCKYSDNFHESNYFQNCLQIFGQLSLEQIFCKTVCKNSNNFHESKYFKNCLQIFGEFSRKQIVPKVSANILTVFTRANISKSVSK